MSYEQAAMAAFAQQVIADCNGRMVTPTGESLNVDGRYGWQCMDLFIYIRYHLGFRDYLPTPDAASVWELNWTHPESTMWTVFDGITPDKPCYPGDIGIMNRQFFNNGVGHIFMIVADLGASIRVLELNGLGDGREDDVGNQHGSPARIHDWPKTYLYGYLRWIGPAPTVSALGDTIIPIQEDQLTPEESARLTNIEALARALYQQLLPGEPGVKDAGNVYLDLAAIRKAAETAADTLAFGVPGVRTAGPVAAQLASISGGLLSIAQGVGSLKSAPATPVPPLDVKALAAELAPLLTTNQAHQFIVALGQALPKQ